jgi:hypothetical protein
MKITKSKLKELIKEELKLQEDYDKEAIKELFSKHLIPALKEAGFTDYYSWHKVLRAAAQEAENQLSHMMR